jgi:hypothetical protein
LPFFYQFNCKVLGNRNIGDLFHEQTVRRGYEKLWAFGVDGEKFGLFVFLERETSSADALQVEFL